MKISPGQDPAKGKPRTVNTQGKIRKPTRPTAKSKAMISSLFKTSFKPVGWWQYCLMVHRVIVATQHKRSSCHRGKKTSWFVCFYSNPDFSLSWGLQMLQFTVPGHHLLWWPTAEDISLFFLPQTTAADYSSCPFHVTDNSTENKTGESKSI